MASSALATDADAAEFGAPCDTHHAVLAVALALMLVLTIPVEVTERMQLPITLCSARI